MTLAPDNGQSLASKWLRFAEPVRVGGAPQWGAASCPFSRRPDGLLHKSALRERYS